MYFFSLYSIKIILKYNNTIFYAGLPADADFLQN